MTVGILQCMPRVRRDIQLCRDFMARQLGGKPHDCELQIQRGIDDVRAYPLINRPVVQLPDVDVWLRRRIAGRFAIVYSFLPPNFTNIPSVVIIRAIKPIRVPNVLEGVPEPPKRKSHDPDTSEAIIDHADDIDWDNIVATTEADDRAGRFAFNSDDYPTWEEAMKAMDALIHSIFEGAIKRAESGTASLDAAS